MQKYWYKIESTGEEKLLTIVSIILSYFTHVDPVDYRP